MYMQDKELKKVGLKVTSPRLKILELLQNNEQRHLSAEEIYKQLAAQEQDIGIATVYRVLTQFEEAGLVVRHSFEAGQSVFELRDEEDHDHLICVKCGDILEFNDDVIRKQQELIAQKFDFKMTDHNMTIYGLCKKCKS